MVGGRVEFRPACGSQRAPNVDESSNKGNSATTATKVYFRTSTMLSICYMKLEYGWPCMDGSFYHRYHASRIIVVSFASRSQLHHRRFALSVADIVVLSQTHEERKAFNRQWARQLFGDAVEAFRRYCGDKGKPQYYQVFERHLLSDDGEGTPSYEDTARAEHYDKGRIQLH